MKFWSSPEPVADG